MTDQEVGKKVEMLGQGEADGKIFFFLIYLSQQRMKPYFLWDYNISHTQKETNTWATSVPGSLGDLIIIVAVIYWAFSIWLYDRLTDVFYKEPGSEYFRFFEKRQNQGQYIDAFVMKKQISTKFLFKKFKT